MNQIITNKLAIIIIKSLRVVPAVNSRPVLADRGILCCRLSVTLTAEHCGRCSGSGKPGIESCTTSYEFL